MKFTLKFLPLFFAFLILYKKDFAQQDEIRTKLNGLDEYMAKALKDWNVPGACIGIVKNDKLIFVKGYGYRDYGKKLPVTPHTLYQIASNTKLFTTVAMGMLVQEGKIDWDKPVRNFVPTVKFYNNDLDNTITIQDMLSHRTGVSRHDLIWYKSDFTRKQLFGKLQYLEPSQPLRQGFLYNNMMYASAGYIIELLTQKKWEDFVRENIFKPLGMNNTVFSIEDMKKQEDYGVPYNEKRDTTLLYQIPFYEETDGLGPAGSIISNVENMSHWLIALMNDGKFEGKQVLPASVLKASLEPSIALPNSSLEKGYTEIQNPVYGMGRETVSYRGHLLTFHGGDLPGFHSQISFMPQDSIGVIVFEIGNQGQPLYNIITYNIYERLLGMSQTPWSERRLKEHLQEKQASREARQKKSVGQIKGTHPSHPLGDYAGQFENPAYGIIRIDRKDSVFQFTLHKIVLPLQHFHYDRFDTPNDEENGQYSLNFYTNPQGDIDRFVVSLDENEATFTRKPDEALSDPAILKTYIGKYDYAGNLADIILENENELFLVSAGSPRIKLIPYKPGIFHTREFADFTIEFTVVNGKVTGMIQKDPSGEYVLTKK
jgi:CubicO group peptidase (beta-lactamase class C family)